jgi:hypothetical protein
MAIEQGPGQQPGDAGDQDVAAGHVRAGHGHDQAEVRTKAVVDAEHGRAQGVAADRAMAPLQAHERTAGHALVALARDQAQQPSVRALVGGHAPPAYLGLTGIALAGRVFGGGDRRQNERDADLAREERIRA